MSQSDDLPFFVCHGCYGCYGICVSCGVRIVMGYHSVGFLVTGGLLRWGIGWLVDWLFVTTCSRSYHMGRDGSLLM